MKKITFLLLTLLAFQFGNAQQTISFETGGGYATGDINTQQGWTTTGCGTGCFVTNQVVSAEAATDGSNSLKIVQETAFGGQANPVVGAFYNYSTPVPGANAIFSADMNISQQDANSSDFIFGLVNVVAGSFRTYVRFTFEGDIFVLAVDGTGTVVLDDTNADWTPNTWFNVKIELVANSIVVSIDDTVIYTGIPATAGDVDQVRFSHDNFQGFAYVDNFRTNDEPTASIDELNLNTFSQYYDMLDEKLSLESSDLPFENIQMFNLLGQEVINQRLSQTSESVNLTNLEGGIYIVKVSIAGQSESFKLLKN